jgi:hypothetical protein
VWNDSEDALLGITVSFDEDRNTGMFLRSVQISRFVGIGIEAADLDYPAMESRVDLLRWLRLSALTSLLEDLEALEANGISPEQCTGIRVRLGAIATAFSDLEDIAVSNEPTFRKFEEFQAAYTQWNNCKTSKTRRNALSTLRERRRHVAKDLKLKASAFSHDDGAEHVDMITRSIRGLTDAFPGVFVSLERSVAEVMD